MVKARVKVEVKVLARVTLTLRVMVTVRVGLDVRSNKTLAHHLHHYLLDHLECRRHRRQGPNDLEHLM